MANVKHSETQTANLAVDSLGAVQPSQNEQLRKEGDKERKQTFNCGRCF